MSTTEYLDTLTIDQLRFARDEADRRIKKAETAPKKILWQVGGGLSLGEVFKEEDHQKALEYFLKSYREQFDARLVDEILNRRTSPSTFRRCIPTLDFIYENEVEYEEWFK